SMQRIYLDANATTPLLPEVVEAMRPFWQQSFGNPSSAHYSGQRTRSAVEHARSSVAALLNAQAKEIVFTSGGTESDNLALAGVLQPYLDRREPAHLITSANEHHAVLYAAEALEKRSIEDTYRAHTLAWSPSCWRTTRRERYSPSANSPAWPRPTHPAPSFIRTLCRLRRSCRSIFQVSSKTLTCSRSPGTRCTLRKAPACSSYARECSLLRSSTAALTSANAVPERKTSPESSPSAAPPNWPANGSRPALSRTLSSRPERSVVERSQHSPKQAPPRPSPNSVTASNPACSAQSPAPSSTLPHHRALPTQ